MCINLCRIVDPEVIIFGGGMAKAGSGFLSQVQQSMRERTWTVLPTSVRLVTASSVEHAGTVGAALAAAHSLAHGHVSITEFQESSQSKWSMLQAGLEAIFISHLLRENRNDLGGIFGFIATAVFFRKYICHRRTQGV